jgi:hypothetical protein
MPGTMTTNRAVWLCLPFAFVITSAGSTRADTFGGQVHAFRARTVTGDAAAAASDRPSTHPGSVTFDAGELAGGDFRLEALLERWRFGAGIGFFGIRDRKLLQPRVAANRWAAAGDGLGFMAESFFGYELLRGPVYFYVDARLAFTAYELPITVRDSLHGEETSWDYHAYALGSGGRAGMLVPIGHSLMADCAVYQRVIGGLEQTTAFVGLGYWENDRSDPFSDALRSSFGGDF